MHEQTSPSQYSLRCKFESKRFIPALQLSSNRVRTTCNKINVSEILNIVNRRN